MIAISLQNNDRLSVQPRSNLFPWYESTHTHIISIKNNELPIVVDDIVSTCSSERESYEHVILRLTERDQWAGFGVTPNLRGLSAFAAVFVRRDELRGHGVYYAGADYPMLPNLFWPLVPTYVEPHLAFTGRFASVDQTPAVLADVTITAPIGGYVAFDCTLSTVRAIRQGTLLEA